MWVWALGVLLAATLGASQPTLFVVMPNLMRFDSLEKVTLEYIGNGQNNNPIQVKVSLQNYPDRLKTFSIQNVDIRPGTQKIVRVITKLSDLPRGSLATKNYVYVKVECSALNFMKEAVVLMTGTKGYLFLQTDKPIYAPEQQVHIRAVSLNPELLPAKTDFTLDVLNPNQTIFERFEGKATKGFFSRTVKLPDVTILGNWTIRATYKNKFQAQSQTSQVSFEVKEYVLPTFSVDIKAPKFILRSANSVQATVTARYVWKEDVKGRLTVVFSLVKKDGSSHTLPMRTFSNFNGQMVVEVPKANYIHKNPQHGDRLVVHATVTEVATGNQETNSDSSALFVKSPYKVSLARTQTHFKPGLPFMVKIELRYASGERAPGIRMEVAATATQSGRHDEVNVFRRDAEDSSFSTNDLGEHYLTLDIPNNVETLKIKVKTKDPNIIDAEQAIEQVTMKPLVTARNNYLSIDLDSPSTRVKVGTKLEVRVDFTENVDKRVTYMIVARGKVVSLNSIPVNGQTKHENINITPQMSPQARLLVYYVSRGNPNEVIADSVVLDVEHTCEDELELSHDLGDDDYRPGDNVNLKVTSVVDTMVSLLGVDKSVYLLSERDILTRDRMFNTIKEMDLGCGAGSGANVGEVFRDSGLHVLTNAVNMATPRRLSVECVAAKSRKRRSASGQRRSASSTRIMNALNKLNDQDQICCQDGFSERVQRDRRSCEVQSTAKTGQGCIKAFLVCCKIERAANTPSGRSGANDEEEINEADLDVARRDDFPEVWINELIEMTDDEFSFVKPLPDSITTWVVSGVSVSEDGGMCVAKPINITAKKEFFVNLDLPYAAVRGEQFEVKATVYNFGRNEQRVEVYMQGDQTKLCYEGSSQGKTVRRRINLAAKSGHTFTFPVVAMQAGEIDIEVTGLTIFAGDKVIKKLKVQAEGVRRYATVSTRLDPEGVMGAGGTGAGNTKVVIDIPNKRQTVEVPLKFPGDAIPGTKVCRVAVSGSLLGPMVPSVDLNMASKIRQPTGCGEQTMIHMGPLVYTSRYMLRTNSLTGNLEKTAYKYILSGFRRELTYKHPDGSYAAWQRTPSSAWLTAFVTKVFCQASLFPNIGKQVAPHAKQAIEWLVKNAQKADGRFYEPRRVYHKEMFGQNLKNDVVFTAFVVEAISKCGGVVS